MKCAYCDETFEDRGDKIAHEIDNHPESWSEEAKAEPDQRRGSSIAFASRLARSCRFCGAVFDEGPPMMKVLFHERAAHPRETAEAREAFRAEWSAPRERLHLI